MQSNSSCVNLIINVEIFSCTFYLQKIALQRQFYARNVHLAFVLQIQQMKENKYLPNQDYFLHVGKAACCQSPLY